MRRTRLSVAAVAVATSTAVVVAPTVAAATPKQPIPVQLLAMNDFHGRISETSGGDSQIVTGPGADGVYGENPDTGETDDTSLTVGGAAHIAATADRLQAEFTGQTGGTSFFVGAGDLISASTFESSVFKDEPTVEALNAMGLDVSSVGNHEFDRGTQELRRVSGATDGTFTDDVAACEGIVPGETGCFGEGEHEFHGTDFPYLAANVISRRTGQPMLPPYEVLEVGGGERLAVIGVVTDTTPTIVSPDGVADVTFIDEAEAVNRWTHELKKQGIRAVAVLVHEGGDVAVGNPEADHIDACTDLSGPIVDLNREIDKQVDLIVSAHSHQAYNCLLPVRGGADRLVTQAGSYGRLVSDIRLTIDPNTGDVDRKAAGYGATNVPVVRQGAGDPEVAGIVAYWEDRAAVAGDVVVGVAAQTMLRGDRQSETSLGNLIADAQLAATQQEQFGSPVIAFMNPGGIRADIEAGEVTYSEIYEVQPFGNTVNAVTLTGADIDLVMEQQYQPRGERAQLVLGTSTGFTWSYDLRLPFGERVSDIRLNGTPIDPAASYRVVANSFLTAGGDDFTAFSNGVDLVTGPVDVDALEAYFAARETVTPPPADHGTQIG